METDISHMQIVERCHEYVRPVCSMYPSRFGGVVLSAMHFLYLGML